MKLFLSGGGSGKDSIKLDTLFASHLDKTKPLLYIPIAMNESHHSYKDCLAWLKNTFEPLEINLFEMWIEKDLQNKTLKDLNNFSGIYIGGGNTFYLLKFLKDSGFYKILNAAIDKDIPIYGGSAGAIILGKTINTAIGFDENDIKLQDLTALNKINEYDIWPHYEPKFKNMINDYIKKYNLKIICLPENTGLFITNKIKVIGPGVTYLANQNMKIIREKD